jgi:hypothetical protein
MNVSVRFSAIAEMKKNNVDTEQYFNYWVLRDLEMAVNEKRDLNQEVGNIDLTDFSKKKTSDLLDILKQYDVNPKTLTTVSLWLSNLSNPNDAIITTLQNLQKLLENVISKSSMKWIWQVNPDGCLVPYYVNEIKYKARYRDEDAYVVISLESTKIKTDRWGDEEISLKPEKEFIYFYRSCICDEHEDELADSYFDQDDDESEDDDKPKKKNTKKGSNSLSKILSKKGVFFTSDEIYENYKRQLSTYQNIKKNIGKVYCSESKAFTIFEGKNNYSSWKQVNVDEKVSKLVIDTLKDSVTDLQKPLHPYLLTYNLTNYCYCVVHVDKLIEYRYDKNIIDKLIISDDKKNLLKAIISNENDFEDIVAGKSGGIIILASGKAGLGKTLTAEAYSELMEKPLYCIQSSQLGVNVDDIEKRLNKILYRAEKWGAVLLIDEADTYIQERGSDIVQNCIVGIFLRLLEYFNGVLFLTTNRYEVIDDAIMSRVTAHIRYEYPTKSESNLIWNVLCKNFGFEIEEKDFEAIYDRYETFSGRDVRNFLKMFSKTSKIKKITNDSITDLKPYLPFVREKFI